MIVFENFRSYRQPYKHPMKSPRKVGATVDSRTPFSERSWIAGRRISQNPLTKLEKPSQPFFPCAAPETARGSRGLPIATSGVGRRTSQPAQAFRSLSTPMTCDISSHFTLYFCRGSSLRSLASVSRSQIRSKSGTKYHPSRSGKEL